MKDADKEQAKFLKGDSFWEFTTGTLQSDSEIEFGIWPTNSIQRSVSSYNKHDVTTPVTTQQAEKFLINNSYY